MLSAEDRIAVRDWIVRFAQADERICAGSLTGSMATGTEDRWSDVDVAFAVVPGAQLRDILDDWTQHVHGEFGVVHHWDLPAGTALYRVFLLRSGLELDIGLCPAAHFGSRGAKFKLAFGDTGDRPDPPMIPEAAFLVGLCWHHARHARAAIARGRFYEAEYYVSALRDHALELACLRLGLPAIYARGKDDLPDAVKGAFEGTLVRSLDEAELTRALSVGRAAFLTELAAGNAALANELRERLF
jgi:hypothetical protein